MERNQKWIGSAGAAIWAAGTLWIGGAALGMEDGARGSAGEMGDGKAEAEEKGDGAGAGGTEPLLAGPRVDKGDRAEKSNQVRTLVEREFDQRLRRLEVDPAIAALEMLELDEGVRAKADAIVSRRNMLFDRLVSEHLSELAAAANASQSGDRSGLRQALSGIVRDTRELREDGRLVDQIAAVLSEEDGKELKRLHSEYWKACVDERMAEGDPRRPGKKLNRIQAGVHEMFVALGQEARRSYERVYGLAQKDFEELLGKLSLTPEQESKIRSLVVDLVQRTNLKPSREESARVFMQAYVLLDAEQRKALLEAMRARNGTGMYAEKPRGAAKEDAKDAKK